ncbi:MAG: response regulator [Fimbriimonadales bacterium]
MLLIEDSEDDARLIVRELRREGFYVEYLQTTKPEEIRNALRHGEWDLVTSDHQMPGFDAPTALRLVREVRPDIPLIILSGQIELQTAVDLMKQGADDYVQKDQLAMLGPSVRAALEHAKRRSELDQAAAILRANERRFRSYFELPLIGLATTDLEGLIVDANDKLADLAGVSRSALIRQPWTGLFQPGDAALLNRLMCECLDREREGFVAPAAILRREGSPVRTLVSARPIQARAEEPITGFLWAVVDSTAESEALQRLTDTRSMLAMLSEVGAFAIAVEDVRTGERLYEHTPQGLECCAIGPDGFPLEKIHPEHLERVRRAFEKPDDEPVIVVFPALAPSGSWVPVVLSRSRYTDCERSEPLRVIVCYRADVQHGAIFSVDALPIPAALLDSEGRVLHANVLAQGWLSGRVSPEPATLHTWPSDSCLRTQDGGEVPVRLNTLTTPIGGSELYLAIAI